MEHGGDLLSYEGYYDGKLVDYSSNINPLGSPKGLEKVIMNGFKDLESYPDVKYRKLKKSVGKYLNCKAENTILGNGAVELIDNFTLLANRVLVCTPSFSEYEQRALIHDKELIRIPYNEDFTVNLKAIKDAIQQGDMLILGNPNNPTGLRIEMEELILIYTIVKKFGGFLLIDEAFFEFCPIDYDSIELFKQTDYKNLGIIRAATKFFALPGIRLGYGCTSLDMVEKIEEIQLPWNINTLAEIAGRYIFQYKEYIKESKRYIDQERKYLLKGLSNISGIKPYFTNSNFILIKLLNWNEEYIFNYFLNRGIVIRKCSSFKGLDDNFIRIAIKDRNGNNRLIKIFKELEESK
ncbi:aminotransferase class I/II-fold pyridoxal phosphate-dependent enzyme [Schnuerera sp. xch1]|uniref:pyridoxal phosphate-dependent aminotransferase n=1 Tax=Schnuerera sp. xch1 TaxID=2874283 RepID=UPI001CBB8035|nr:histidinol-phosphate transaminase [Schnuerera sp. xch1]MBZ2175524.1 aminotransferase class I/II-fold pyridoxal phosphate-dependent enzyme [Schnuerera sp. xch1]